MDEVSGCIHEWDWDLVYTELVCLKCGVRVDEGDIASHMTRLESQLAESKAKRATLMDCFFEFEAINPKNGELEASVLDMANELDRTRKELAERDAFIERLVEAGEKVVDDATDWWDGGAIDRFCKARDEWKERK